MTRIGERPMDRPKQTIKKFYETASYETVDGGFQILLDGKQTKTPAKNNLVVPTVRMAEAIVAEWRAQQDDLDFALMPMTQRQMVLLDRSADDEARWRQIIVDYIHSDLLCYRAEDPQELVDRQEAEWGAVLGWAEQRLGHKLAVTTGIISVPQPPALLATTKTVLAEKPLEDVFALCSLTQFTGSAVIALALVEGHLDAKKGFALSRLDETYQAEKWGQDAESMEREALLKGSFEADLAWLQLARDR